jgi:hypothetical protein
MKGGKKVKATKIRMKSGSEKSNDLLEIDSIYLTGAQEETFYKKAAVYDYLKGGSGDVEVNIYPYPKLIPRLSVNNEKYVESTADSSNKDNLLNLPRE